ncbi:MAG: glycogen synthase [Chloroflexi bacterium]|nr:glycogen synthase [Chloroflexota bacterium]
MRIAMVASECEPFAKTGGLADVVDALARALGARGHEVDVYLPLYRGLRPPEDLDALATLVPVGADPANGSEDGFERVPVVVRSGRADGYRLRLVDHEPSFDRAGFYGDARGDYPDNGLRFTLLGRAALETMRAEARPADVLHGHDWQAGPAILSLRTRYAHDPLLARMGTMLTCHNLAYHGWVPRDRAWELDLPRDIGDDAGVDLLRETVRRADLVNTVSPSYARESLGQEYGAGLDDVLRDRGDRYIGIMNGIDPTVWDPARDRALAAPFSADDVSGRAACRADLCARLGLSADGPVLGVIGRLDPQKGFDLVTAGAPALLAMGARLAILGTGDAQLIAGLRAIGAQHPDRIAILDRFDRDEARRIYAGSDMFLMPSRFEPSGQGQLIALRYGSVPLVRATGGLLDTITDADLDPERGNGFTFGPADPDALVSAARRAIAAWQDRDRWQVLMAQGMHEDHGWDRPAERYEEAYRTLRD